MPSTDDNRSRIAVVIPAYNEEASIGSTLAELGAAMPGVQAIVINDGSSDRTGAVARAAGAMVLVLPCNIGVGGAVQAGFQYALSHGFEVVARIDADGQHPPAELPKLLEALGRNEADLVIGSRFLGDGFQTDKLYRFLGIKMLAAFLSVICRKRVTDPTSGFWAMNRKLLALFANDYPVDYPEPEAIALLRRQGYSFREHAVAFRPRTAGRSSIRKWGTIYYALKVGLALVVDRVRPVDRRLSRERIGELLDA
jgi:glycosyltransferase involved in cell wall biosynthesis